MTRCWDMASWSFFKMAAGRNLGFDPTGNGTVRSAVRARRPHPRTKHEVDQNDALLNYGHSFSHCDRRSEIGHRTRKWFDILSNAAMHCIGQTINNVFCYKSMQFVSSPACSFLQYPEKLLADRTCRSSFSIGWQLGRWGIYKMPQLRFLDRDAQVRYSA